MKIIRQVMIDVHRRIISFWGLSYSRTEVSSADRPSCNIVHSELYLSISARILLFFPGKNLHTLYQRTKFPTYPIADNKFATNNELCHRKDRSRSGKSRKC